MEGWVVATPEWVSLGSPVEVSVAAPNVGVITQTIRFRIYAERAFVANIIALDTGHSTEFWEMNSRFFVSSGDSFDVTLTRPYTP